ncbi:MAG: lipoyl(octanoyl) transferase LipB [Terriglobia bacterium]
MDSHRPICAVIEWGQEPYGRVWGWQKELVAARKAGAVPDLLLLGEHPHVITLGRNASRANLRLPEAELARRGIDLAETDRGGDVTYHGPGQLIGYPILDLGAIRKDVVWYVRALEEVLIGAARELGVKARRQPAPEDKSRRRRGQRPFYTGVWVGEEKLAAIGVHISRWVTSHGFAFNLTTDLSYFDLIVPCGIRDKRVTSLAQLLQHTRSAQRPQPLGPTGRGLRAEQDRATQMAKLKRIVIRHFGEVFGRTMTPIAPETWEEWVGAQQAAAS